jgi:ATP-dependent Clp protease ATP-binding subunit ClpC
VCGRLSGRTHRAAPAGRGYPRRVFERFTERARQVIVLAQDEARHLRHDHIGTEHILLGVLREEGVGRRALASIGVEADEVRARVGRIVGEGDDVTMGQILFTPRAKRVLELALREPRGLGHDHIGPEHILLALVREGDGVAARILLELSADAARVRAAVFREAAIAPGPGYERAMQHAERSLRLEPGPQPARGREAVAAARHVWVGGVDRS